MKKKELYESHKKMIVITNILNLIMRNMFIF